MATRGVKMADQLLNSCPFSMECAHPHVVKWKLNQQLGKFDLVHAWRCVVTVAMVPTVGTHYNCSPN